MEIIIMNGRFWEVCTREFIEAPEVYSMTVKPIELDSKLIAKELQWCVGNSGQSLKSADYEQGFMSGLKQAMEILRTKPVIQDN